eukprot:Seg2610.4 transcript_id=Seg2610.4/GoldUCD/mRNA.D3Y31 product="hypothetical protein" protein_id=Seg2610.4/GoldUCD/D3Y31
MFTILNTAEFIGQIRNEKVPQSHKMVSFDVKSLFTNVPLEKTINIIIRKVYDENMIDTEIGRAELQELLLLCTRHVHFIFGNETYVQTDGVAMGSPLGPLLANIFMVELEEQIIPTLSDDLIHWKRYVDDTHAYIREDKINDVIEILNSFDANIQFTYEIEENGTIPFLDVLIKRCDDGHMETSVYRKKTNTDLYINWKSHAPVQWKSSTLKGLVKRAILISSTKETMEQELEHLKHVFCKINDYPRKFVEKIVIDEMRKEDNRRNNVENNIHNDKIIEEGSSKSDNRVQLTLPYARMKGVNILAKMKRTLKHYLKSDTKPFVAY